MYAKTENLNRDERMFLRKISDIVHWAKQNNRQDILEHAESYGTIQKPTQLMRAYYALNQMKKGKDVSVQKNQSTGTMNNIPNTDQPDKQAQPVGTPTPAASQENNQPQPSSPQPDNNGSDYDPLLQSNVKQRDYTGGMSNAGSGSPTQPVGSIPEPDFNQRPSGFGTVPPDQKDNRFEALGDLPPGEKAKTSEALADIIVDFWCTNIPKLATQLATVSDNKLNRMAMKGEINTQLTINVPEVGAMTVRQYFTAMRHQVEAGFQVKEEWKQEVKPILTRVLAKKNWGVTDEQQLLYMAGSQVVPLIFAAIQVNQSNKELLEQLRYQTQQLQSEGIIPPPPSSSTPPPPPPPPSPEPTSPEIITPEAEEIIPEANDELVHIQTFVEQDHSIAPARTARGDRRNMPPEEETQQVPTVNQTLNKR